MQSKALRYHKVLLWRLCNLSLLFKSKEFYEFPNVLMLLHFCHLFLCILESTLSQSLLNSSLVCMYIGIIYMHIQAPLVILLILLFPKMTHPFTRECLGCFRFGLEYKLYQSVVTTAAFDKSLSTSLMPSNCLCGPLPVCHLVSWPATFWTP